MQFPIRTRLLITYLVLILLALSILGAAVLWPLQNYYLSHLENELIKNGTLIAEIMEPYVREQNYSQIDSIAKDLGNKIDTRITVIGTDGQVLGESEQDIYLMENHSDRPEFQEALKGKIGTATRFSTTINTDTLYVALPLHFQGQTQGVIRLALPILSVQEAVTLLRGTLLIGFIIASSVALLLSVKLSRTITKPIEEISKITNKIARGDLEQKIYNTSKDEIGLLSQAINGMTGSLKSHIYEITAGKQRIEAILNHMASGVLVINKKGLIEGINSEAVRMFGVEEKGIINKAYQSFIRNFAFQGSIEEAIKHGFSPTSLEFSLLFPQKTIVKAYISPVVYNGQTEQVVVVFHDITSLRKLEKIKTEFVANASHELRTPVAAIKGFSETLLDGALEDPGAAHRFVTIIDKEADRLTRLINDLLDLSRIELKNVILEKTPSNIKEVFEDCYWNLAQNSEDKGVAILMDFDPQLPQIMANKDLLTRAFLNLMDNGIKYTPRGGTLKISSYTDNGYLILKFADTGVGIPKEDLPRIFERFYRVDKARTQDIKGTGLGLSIVKHIIEQHRGYIHVQSEVGKGTTFTVTLPIK